MAQAVSELGCGTEIAKADIKVAYRQVPVHPQDRPLLAMHWQDKVYVDTALACAQPPNCLMLQQMPLNGLHKSRGITFVALP